MIRAKLVLRNVISKPLRTAIIILSLAAAAFAALFCIAGIHSAQNGLRDYFRSNYGDADTIISCVKGKIQVEQSDLPAGSRVLGVAISGFRKTVPNEQYFNYVSLISVNVMGMDTKLAHQMGMIDSVFPTENGATITQVVAQQFDKKVGDTLEFEGEDGKKYALKILQVVPATRFMKNFPMSIVVTPELSNEIGDSENGSFHTIYVDTPNDKISENMVLLSQKYPDHIFISTDSMDSDDTMNSMLNIYYLIFAVVFLMVCFIVVSMSKHIVNERMSVIGMLRSIGGSIRGTGVLLLSESIFYGLCGGVLGTILFLLLKNNFVLGLFEVGGLEEGASRSDGINFWTICLIILAVTAIQCLFSAAAIFKAARTPVRDIIFGTKETAYQPSKMFSIFGGILLVLGVAAFFFFNDFLMTIAAAFCSVVGIVMLFPMIVTLVSKFLADLFGKANMPVARLAAKEICTTKSSVSSSQLIVSAISLTIAVLVLAVSLIALMSDPFYHSELVITGASQEGNQYDYIGENVDDVQGVEKLYYQSLQYDMRAKVNGVERDMMLMGYPSGGFRYFTGIRNCPEALGKDEIAVDKVLAGKMSLHVGDEISLEVNRDKYIPSELHLKVKCLIDGSYFNSMGNTVLINLDTYQSAYFDNPCVILIKTKPGKELSVLRVLRSTMADNPISVRLTEDYMAEAAESMKSILTIIYAVVVLGLALSLMGTYSNMLMGFEQSRRKYAVYYSSSMSKSKLKRLIVLETILTSGLSAIAAMIFGVYFLQIISKALSTLNLSVPLVQPVFYALLFGIGAFIILLTVMIKPIRMLSRMNIAEEIKTSAD